MRKLFHRTPLVSAGLILMSVMAVRLAYSQERAVKTAELTQTSDVVVVGRVLGIRSEWSADKTRIQSVVSVSVGQQLKGQAGSQAISIVTPGGEVDGVGEVYSHVAKFKNDEEVVVFAKRDKENKFRVAGGSQGKFTVKRDQSSGKAMVTETKSLDELLKEVTGSIERHEEN